MDHLQLLESKSVHILREAYREFKSLCMLWSIGKDSTVLLHLARKAFFGHGFGATGEAVKMPANPESPTVNNRIRGELASALAALKLFDADVSVRLASAQKLQSQVTPEMAPLWARALEKESDAQIKALIPG